jgi:hypothetical protein
MGAGVGGVEAGGEDEVGAVWNTEGEGGLTEDKRGLQRSNKDYIQ